MCPPLWGDKAEWCALDQHSKRAEYMIKTKEEEKERKPLNSWFKLLKVKMETSASKYPKDFSPDPHFKGLANFPCKEAVNTLCDSAVTVYKQTQEVSRTCSIRISLRTLRLQFHMIFTCHEFLFFSHLIRKLNGSTKVHLSNLWFF